MKWNLWYARNVNGLPVAGATEPVISKDQPVLRPMLDAHSIESISLTCEYDGDVSSFGLSVIKEESSRLKLKYQNRRVARRPGNNGDSFNSDSSEVVGYSFLSKDSERELSKFDVINDNAIVMSFAYTSFKSFFADVAFSLEVANKAFVKSERKLEKIILSYRNSFLAESAEEIHGAIRKSSPYVASACLDNVNFWHTKLGFFSNEPYTYPLFLHNVSVTHMLLKVDELGSDVDAPNTHQLQIDMHHVVNVSGSQGVEEFTSLLETMALTLRSKHLHIFRGIVTDEVSGLVGLSKE